MKFNVVSIFPEAFTSYLSSSILNRARNRGLIKVEFFNPRDFVKDKHKVVDDRPFGGGPGMVMKAEPILKAVEAALKRKTQSVKRKTKIVLLSARGKPFTQKTASSWAKKYKGLVLVSGRYEGVDERVKRALKAEEVSAGPYILSGGELPAMIVIDAVSRHIKEVLGKSESLEERHGSYPVYTRPEVLKYKKKDFDVPKVLLSGNHKKIAAWRKKHELS